MIDGEDGEAKRDLLRLLGDRNVKVGSDNSGFETVMRKHDIGKMNENGELFVDFCSFNKLVTGGSVFPHTKVHKMTTRPGNSLTTSAQHQSSEGLCWMSD